MTSFDSLFSMDSDSRSKQSNFNILGKMRRAENSKGKKTNVTVPDAMKLERPVTAPAPNGVMKIISQNSGLLLQTAGAAFVIMLSLSMYNSSSSAIQNLVNADPEVLKTAFMGDQPYLFYCHRGGKDETVPSTFSELNKLKGSKMGFALLNCSQTLPSGKNLFERFKLKQEIKPTMFETVPWGKPTQVTKKELKDVASLKKFVEVTMAPKAVEVYSDKDMMKQCGFSVINKTAAADVNSRGETCFVLVKGSKHNKFNSDLEERIVRANPKVKIVTVDAIKKRLSFEDPENLPASTFEIKVHALRNSTHYMSMVNPLTWDYVSTFMSQAISSPSYSFLGDAKNPIKLIKTGSSAFKNRSATSPNSQPTAKKSKSQSQSQSSGSTDKKSTNSKNTGSTAKDNTKVPEEVVQETVAERFAREMRRRDEMERQSKEHLFEDNNDDGESNEINIEEDVVEDDEDENVIEL